MSPSLEKVLEISPPKVSPAPTGSHRRTSKIAKTSFASGILAAIAGFTSLLCERPRHGWMFIDTSDALAAAVILTILFSLLGLLFALIGAVRIAASGKTVQGYGLCLAGVALALVANALWMIFFSISL